MGDVDLICRELRAGDGNGAQPLLQLPMFWWRRRNVSMFSQCLCAAVAAHVLPFRTPQHRRGAH